MYDVREATNGEKPMQKQVQHSRGRRAEPSDMGGGVEWLQLLWEAEDYPNMFLAPSPMSGTSKHAGRRSTSRIQGVRRMAART